MIKMALVLVLMLEMDDRKEQQRLRFQTTRGPDQEFEPQMKEEWAQSRLRSRSQEVQRLLNA